jgi:hypothetical protein
MPHEWNNILVVTLDELVPDWFGTVNTLNSTIRRYKDKSYGIKRVQLGGNGRQMLISFDSLPRHIQDGLGDPRKCDHILEKYYKVDGEAVRFFADYRFADGTTLDMQYQEKYIINASMIKSIFALKSARETERRSKGGSLVGIMSTLCSDAISFNKTLKTKHGIEHTLPNNERRFKEALKDFEIKSYASVISGKHKNQNTRKVYDHTLQLLNSMFASDYSKPTATEIHRRYETFLSGYLTVINNDTAELYNPKDYKQLSAATVKTYLLQKWENKIGTFAARSGDRQKLMQQFKTYHSLKKPEFAGSIISIDDRQPPFKTPDGKRVWAYMGIDLGSEAFTTWVFGHNKEGLIVDFYRQMVRNYAEWGMNLPAELEAEMSLNSSFKDTLLREGAMFQHVRIEANNARGKRIEKYFDSLRYEVEKDREGWIARPFAKEEANQAGSAKVPELPFDEIIEGCLRDIETWNNMPHSVHTHMSRWEVFCQMQHPDLRPTNYQSILPYIGHTTKTSCNVGIIRLQSQEFLLAENSELATGDKLISLMKEVEGYEIDVHWLRDNNGQILKALVYRGTQYICEATAKPTYHRAKIEQTAQDLANRELMSKYVATIEAFGKRQKKALDQITIIDNTPARPKTFIMPGLRKAQIEENWQQPEILETADLEDEIQVQPTKRTLLDRW